MAQLNFPTTGLTTGTQYTGDNGVVYIYDGVKWVGHMPNVATATNSIINGSYVVQVNSDGNLVIPDNAAIVYQNGSPVVTGGGSTGTNWDLTSQGNGCPINVTLTTTTFDVQVPRNHLFFNEDGSWDIGSYTNGNYITGDTSANFNIVTNFEQNTWKFDADGVLTLAGVPSPNFFADRGTIYYQHSGWFPIQTVGTTIHGFPGAAAGAWKFNKTLYDFDFTMLKLGDILMFDSIDIGYPNSPGTIGYPATITVSQQDPDNADLWIIGTTQAGPELSNGHTLWLRYGEESIVLNDDWGFSNSTLYIPDNAKLATNDKEWTFGNDGKLKLPAGGDIVDSNGTSVLGGGSSGPIWQLTSSTSQVSLNEYGALIFSNGTRIQDYNNNFSITAEQGTGALIQITAGGAGAEGSAGGDLRLYAGDSGDHGIRGTVDIIGDTTQIRNDLHQWTFAADGTTAFPDNTIKTTTSTKITVLGTSGTTGTYAWYNIFGELNNSTSTQNTTDGSVAYDSDGNVYVLGSTTDWAASQFDGTNLFMKYSPQGELLWRKTWTDPTGDPCGSYNASMRFVPLAGTATAGIVWASNGQGWTSSDRIGYVGTMDLDGNLVDLYGNARAPRAISDYRITDIVPLEYGGFDGAYISGSWWDRAGTGDSYASIGGLDFNHNAISGTNFVFIPEYQQPDYSGAHFKSINGAIGGLWATGSFPNTTYSGNTKTPIVGILVANTSTPMPYLFTIGEDYIAYDMWIEDSGSDDAGNCYMLVNVYGYNHSVHSSANDYTVVLSNSLSIDLAIDRWQKNITRVGANDGRFNTLGLGLVNYGDYVYVSMYLGETGNDSDLALLKLNATTGELVWARTIGSPANEGNWNFYSDGWNSSSDITIDPTGTYITFSANTHDRSTSTQYCNNFTIQYPLDGSLLGTYGDFTITDTTADFVVTNHDFTVTDITSSTTISQLSLSVSTATLTASATTVGSGWTNIRQPMGYDGPSTPDQTWTFGSDGALTVPGDIVVGDNSGHIYIDQDLSGATSIRWVNVLNNSEMFRVYSDSRQDVNHELLRAGFDPIDNPGFYITTMSTATDNTWTFGTNGITTIPGDIQDVNGSVIRVASTSTAPARVNGQLWFNNAEGRLYIKDNGAWVDANPTVIPPPSTYLDDITVEGSTFTINGSTLTIDSTGTLLVNGGQVTGGGGGNVGFEYATIQEGTFGPDGAVTSITGNHGDGVSLTSDIWAQLMWVPDTRSVTIGDIFGGGARYNWAYTGSEGFHIENKSTSTRSWLFDTKGNIELPAGGQHQYSRIQTLNGYPTLMAYGSGGGEFLHGGPELDWMDSEYPDRDFFNNTTTRHTLYLNNNGLYVGINENNVAGQPSVSWNFNPDGSLLFPNGARLYDDDGGINLGARWADRAEFDDKVIQLVTTETGGGEHVWRFQSDGTLRFPSGAGFANGEIGGQLKTDDGNTLLLDFRDSTGRGFYTNSDGVTLRSNGSYNWILTPNGTTDFPGPTSLDANGHLRGLNNIAFQGWGNNIGRRGYQECNTGTTTVIWTSTDPSVTSMRLTVHAEVARRDGNANWYENFDTETTELLVAVRYLNNVPTLARVAVIGSVSTLDTSLATYDVQINGLDLVELTCTPTPTMIDRVITKVEYSESGSSSGEDYC